MSSQKGDLTSEEREDGDALVSKATPRLGSSRLARSFLNPLTKLQVDIDELLLREELKDQRRTEKEREEEHRFEAHQLWKAKWSAASALAQARLAIARQKIEQQDVTSTGLAANAVEQEHTALLRQIVLQNNAILDQQEEQAALLRVLAARPV